MQFKSREDIEAPIEFVFDQVTDFPSFERQALRRGADVRKRDSNPQPGLGSGWDVTFKYRGKDRLLSAEIIHFEAGNSFVLDIRSGGISGQTLVDLVALSRGRTRLSVVTELAAQGLTARLLLQSLKLAKTNLAKRMSGRISAYANDIEDRYARQS
jgi:hypothetical protein